MQFLVTTSKENYIICYIKDRLKHCSLGSVSTGN